MCTLILQVEYKSGGVINSVIINYGQEYMRNKITMLQIDVLKVTESIPII
jgi:hypothetical protein